MLRFSSQIRRLFSTSVQLPLYRQIQEKVLPDNNILAPIKPWTSTGLPQLVRKPDSILVKYWWSECPFDASQELWLPVFSLKTQEFTSEVIKLEPLLFNQPIRRDIVHRVNNWSLFFNKVKTHRTKTIAEIHGSGRKPRPQKGTGRARAGNKRAAGRYKGTKNWGPRPKDYTYHLPLKVKLQGIISCLSAKLAEGKIRVVDSEKLDSHKTNNLYKMLPDLGKKELFLFVTGKEVDKNFSLAVASIDRCKAVNPNHINVRDLLKFDKIIFTKQSLNEMTQFLLCVLYMNHKPKGVRDEKIEHILNLDYKTDQPDKENVLYNPESDFEPKFQILKDYYNKYKEMQKTGELKHYEKKQE